MIHVVQDGVVIDVRVVPRSGRSGVAGTRDGALLVRVTAPPVEGAANDELIAVIGEALGVPKRAVTIVAGEHGRRKRVKVAGVSESDVRARLALA
jgi:uncharacterized protein (TIGR00251 family)